jgi:hypothetical protein
LDGVQKSLLFDFFFVPNFQQRALRREIESITVGLPLSLLATICILYYFSSCACKKL